MSIALRELWRRPSRFLAAGGALTLLVVLLLVLGGFLDGLVLGSTGALRAQDGQLVVFSDAARSSLLRSQVDADTAARVAEIDGVERVGGLGINQTVARMAGAGEGVEDLIDVAVGGYELATQALPEPPGPGGVLADERLATLEIVGWVEDTAYGGRPSLWVAPDTWRAIVAASGPGGMVGEASFQALVVHLADADDDDTAADVAAAIDQITGTTTTITLDEAIAALPGVSEQTSTFQGIIGVTFGVAGLVVALFFALITIERARLYAVLKALGATSKDLVLGVTAQAIGVAVGAIVVGGVLSVGLVWLLPADLPIRLEPARIATIAIGTLLTAILGSLVTLRRILRVDPAASIG